MKIYLIRHGQTTGDVEDRYGGDYDDRLTELGKRQAEKLGRELRDAGIEKIFASPLARSRETANIFSRKIGVSIEFVENLRERSRYGVLTGMIKSEGAAKFPKLAETVKTFAKTIEGAEEFGHFEDRIIEAFYNLLLKPFNTIAVITHGGPLRVLASEVLGHTELKDKMEDCGWALIINSGDGSLTIEKTKGFLI
jgi:broad specificity phosphatase PhoE